MDNEQLVTIYAIVLITGNTLMLILGINSDIYDLIGGLLFVAGSAFTTIMLYYMTQHAAASMTDNIDIEQLE